MPYTAQTFQHDADRFTEISHYVATNNGPNGEATDLIISKEGKIK